MLNIYRVYGASVAAADTGTIQLNFKPVLGDDSLPVVIGLPHGITKTFSGNTLTLTAVGTYTNLNQEIGILGAK